MKNCGNCIHYVGGFCWADVNNMDPSLLDRERDSRKPDESCDRWEHDELNDDE